MKGCLRITQRNTPNVPSDTSLSALIFRAHHILGLSLFQLNRLSCDRRVLRGTVNITIHDQSSYAIPSFILLARISIEADIMRPHLTDLNGTYFVLRADG